MTEPRKDLREPVLTAPLLRDEEKLNLVCPLLHSCHLVEAQHMAMC